VVIRVRDWKNEGHSTRPIRRQISAKSASHNSRFRQHCSCHLSRNGLVERHGGWTLSSWVGFSGWHTLSNLILLSIIEAVASGSPLHNFHGDKIFFRLRGWCCAIRSKNGRLCSCIVHRGVFHRVGCECSIRMPIVCVHLADFWGDTRHEWTQ